MYFQKPNPWISDCLGFLTSGAEHHLQTLKGRSVRKVTFFDTLCFFQQAGLICDSLCENLLGARLAALLTHARAANLMPLLFVASDSNIRKRNQVVLQATRSSERLLFWERLLCWLICREHDYVYDSRVINPLRRQLVIEALLETPGHLLRTQAHERAGQTARFHDFLWQTLWSDIPRWLPRFDFEFLDALLRAPQVLERITTWQWEEISFKFDVDHQDKAMAGKHYAELIRMCTAGVLHGLKTPDHVFASFAMAINAKPGSQPEAIERAVKCSLSQLEGISNERLAYLLTVLVPGCRRDVIAVFETQSRYGAVLRTIEPVFAAKLVATSPLRDRWLQEYPEITEHVLARELGL